MLYYNINMYRRTRGAFAAAGHARSGAWCTTDLVFPTEELSRSENIRGPTSIYSSQDLSYSIWVLLQAALRNTRGGTYAIHSARRWESHHSARPKNTYGSGTCQVVCIYLYDIYIYDNMNNIYIYMYMYYIYIYPYYYYYYHYYYYRLRVALRLRLRRNKRGEGVAIGRALPFHSSFCRVGFPVAL